MSSINLDEELKYYVLPSLVRISPSAIELARGFREAVFGADKREDWIICFDWALAQSIQEPGGPSIDMGPGLCLGAGKRQEIPAAAIHTVEGIEVAIKIPKEIWQNAAERLIDTDDKAFGKVVLR